MQDDQMIEIKAYDLHWLNRVEDNPNDLCAHGSVAITIDEQRFVPEDEYCVSAAAVYLLRTLDEGYEKSDQDEQLIPHCGHSMFEVENSDLENCLKSCHILQCNCISVFGQFHCGHQLNLGHVN